AGVAIAHLAVSQVFTQKLPNQVPGRQLLLQLTCTVSSFWQVTCSIARYWWHISVSKMSGRVTVCTAQPLYVPAMFPAIACGSAVIVLARVSSGSVGAMEKLG